VGCGGWEGHLLSSALGDDRPAGLTRAWRALLQAALPQPALPGYYELVESLTHGARTDPRPRECRRGRSRSGAGDQWPRPGGFEFVGQFQQPAFMPDRRAEHHPDRHSVR